MYERRLTISLTIAIFIPFVILGLLLPTPSLAIDPAAASIQIIGADCSTVNYVNTRIPTIVDGTDSSNNKVDYYRVVVLDSDGNIVFQREASAQFGASTTVGNQNLLFSRTPHGTSVRAFMYEQTQNTSSQPNGALLAISNPYPLSCTISTAAPATYVPSTAVPPTRAPPTVIPTGIPPTGIPPTGVLPTTIPPTGVPPTAGVPTNVPTQAPTAAPSYPLPAIRALATILTNAAVYDAPDGSLVVTLKAGQTWFVTRRDSSGRFYEIFLGGPNMGWIRASEVQLQSALPGDFSSGPNNDAVRLPVPLSNSNALGTAVIQAYNLRIHSGPGLNQPQIGLAHQNDVYTVLDRNGDWLNVTGPGGIGWIRADFANVRRVPVQSAAAQPIVVIPAASGANQPVRVPDAVPGNVQLIQLPDNNLNNVTPVVIPASSVIHSAPLAGVILPYTLRLRIAPGISAQSIGMAHQGEVYTVLGQSPNGHWLDISGPAGSGWIDGAFMRVLGARSDLPVVR